MKITVITINYNNKEGLEKTIPSVLHQTYPNIEYIVIDGGSTDGSKEYIETQQASLAYWVSEPDRGIYHAMNKGIEKATGEYIIFLNSGDFFVSEFIIEKATAYQLDTDLIYGDLRVSSIGRSNIMTYPNKLSLFYFYDKGHIPHPATFIKRQLFLELGLYREDFKIVSDWDFFVKAIFKHDASYRHIDLLITDYDTNGISGTPSFRPNLLTEKAQSLQDHFPDIIGDMEQLKTLSEQYAVLPISKWSAMDKSKMVRKLNAIWMTFGATLANFLNGPGIVLKRIFKKSKPKLRKRSNFLGSKLYWEGRYTSEGNSGAGSYGQLAIYKADVLNDFVSKNQIQKVLEMGCGDGNQLSLAKYPFYIGLDVSNKAIALCRKKFSGDTTKEFYVTQEYVNKDKSELSLSLDVIFHLTEDEVFDQYMSDLFSNASKYVIIYSSNYEERIASHVRSWKFTDWIDQHLHGVWELQAFIPNKYQFDKSNPDHTSISDFYIYRRRSVEN